MLSGVGEVNKLQAVHPPAPAEKMPANQALPRQEAMCRDEKLARDEEKQVFCCLHDRFGKPLFDREGNPRRVRCPGVGRNLQDRYEVTVVSEMKHDFSLLKDATFKLPDATGDSDRHLREWRRTGQGLYASNGAVLGILKRSRPDLAQPDLFIFGIPSSFKGYEPGYSNITTHNLFTWTILKSHTNNRGGTVELTSPDPRDVPEINFHYFNEGMRDDQGAGDPDLLAILEGVKFVREIPKFAQHVIVGENHPYKEGVSETDEDVKAWIRRSAWGHHACGTCRMGPDGDDLAVLDSRFRVRNVQGLRIVDASIFPSIPGYFIVTNIYMASEKAADVIWADFQSKPADTPFYSHELRMEETDAINERRKHVPSLADVTRPPKLNGKHWSSDVTGLALSGGGIRSATLNFGILQAMAESHWLRRIDFLSTVSGGGYIGTFLGRFFDRLRPNPLTEKRRPDECMPEGPIAEERVAEKRMEDAGVMVEITPVERVEEELRNPASRFTDWLRRHGNYIAPNGGRDLRVGIAAALRDFLSVHFVVGLLLFALFGLANAIRYGLFDPATAGLGLALAGKGDLPLGHLVQSLLGPFFSPWFMVFELLLLFLVLPRMVGYWIVSQDKHERFQVISLPLLFIVGSILLWLGVRQGLSLEFLVLGLALFSSLVPVELAWRRGRIREEALGSGGVESQRLRTRNYLTEDLGLMVALTGLALGFALIDTLGHGLHQWLVERNVSYATAFAALGTALAALLPIARLAANWLATPARNSRAPSTIARIFREQLVAGLLALVLLVVPLTFYSFAAHAVYQGGTASRTALVVGLAATFLAIVLSLILRSYKAITFVNRSSLSQLYAARLARAYLGASNPLRHRADGGNISEVIAGDDVASIRDYRPHEAGGPFHLINVVVNQTVDFASQRGNRDRQGENLAVSCLGMSIGQRYHSVWKDAYFDEPRWVPAKRPTRLEPVGHGPGDDHPLVDEMGNPTDRAEMISLRQWMSISGAAIGPGRGQTTALGTALLFGLANLRTGYWWDSGINEAARNGFPKLTFLRRLLHVLPYFFHTQSLLLFEWVGRFAGPWARFWNLSDGGFFENIGGYELVRRRVPRIILCDATADPDYEFESFAEFVRKVRIDFGANVTPLTSQELDQNAKEVRALMGTPGELKPTLGGPAAKHATLYWIDYETGPKRRSVLLYLKATITGQESDDVKNYHATHPEFPHESTGDQVFNEAQWESYRKLGEQMLTRLVGQTAWFWEIPL
jgi:hypothetical protein